MENGQVGKRKCNRVSCAGRGVLDVYLWMLNNFKLDEYKLDAVCKVFLKGEGMAKEDLHFTEISPKWHSGSCCPFLFVVVVVGRGRMTAK